MSFAVKKRINKELRDIGIQAFDVAAVNLLAEHIEAQETAPLSSFIQIWNSDGFQGDKTRLTVESVQAVLAKLSSVGQQALELISVINAFDIPKISYDPVGRKLYSDTQNRSIFAAAKAKQQLYIDRLHLINQRVRRSSIFKPRSLTAAPDVHMPQLTDIQSLKGVVGANRYVIGCISRAEDGRYMLEDHSGAVPLSMGAAHTAAGFYTENCIVIAEGEMQVDGVFHAEALGHPPCEQRDHLPMAAQRLNFFGGRALNSDEVAELAVAEMMDHSRDRLVVLANVHLDRREVLDSLNDTFAMWHELEELPVLFVLMGNFHSRAATGADRAQPAFAGPDMDYPAMRDHFDSLAALIDQYPRIKVPKCRFVFVPGPGDPGPSTALPMPPLPAFLTAQLQKVLPTAIFASNPCRIRYMSKEIVLFRYDILSRMRRRCLIPPAGVLSQSGGGTTQGGSQAAATTQATAESMWGHLALTLLQQSHLCPLPLLQQPIYWQYDHALHLYPLPHAVIVADSSPQAQYKHEGCVVFNPGSFAEGNFAGYKPCQQEVELNQAASRGDAGAFKTYEDYEQEGEAGAAAYGGYEQEAEAGAGGYDDLEAEEPGLGGGKKLRMDPEQGCSQGDVDMQRDQLGEDLAHATCHAADRGRACQAAEEGQQRPSSGGSEGGRVEAGSSQEDMDDQGQQLEDDLDAAIGRAHRARQEEAAAVEGEDGHVAGGSARGEQQVASMAVKQKADSTEEGRGLTDQEMWDVVVAEDVAAAEVAQA